VSDIDRAAREAAEKLKQLAAETASELDRATAEAEAVRVSAEEERQTHEVDRKIAEGGQDAPGDDETGRVEAESGRQEAEARRVLRDQKLLPRISALIALPLALVVLIPSLLLGYYLYDRSESTRNVSEDNREAIEHSNDAIKQVRALALAVRGALQARDEALSNAIAQRCRDNEAQDAIIVSVLRATGLNPKVELPPDVRQDFRDAIVALEPKGEKPCPLQTGIRP